jgi:hypothetical protein
LSASASEHFRRSPRLRDFLLYVGHQSQKEGCPEIHEQEIGAKVFGRSSSYDLRLAKISIQARAREHSYWPLDSCGASDD